MAPKAKETGKRKGKGKVTQKVAKAPAGQPQPKLEKELLGPPLLPQQPQASGSNRALQTFDEMLRRVAALEQQAGTVEQPAAAALTDQAGRPQVAMKPDDTRDRIQTLLLHILRDAEDSNNIVSIPILEHRWRRRGSYRGLSLPVLESLLELYEVRGESNRMLLETCRDLQSPSSICSLTRTTGLSFAETVVLTADREGISCEGLVGKADGYFVYGWLGTSIGDLLRASIRTLRRQEQLHGRGRKLFIDLFGASQNLICGRYGRHGAGREGARAEDYDATFESVFDVCDTVVLHLSPLAVGAQWPAPLDTHRVVHQYLDESMGSPEVGWMREGPVALTRAWCVKELAQGLGAGCSLQLESDDAGHATLLELVGRGEIERVHELILVDREFRHVQIRRASDRARIQRILEAAGGYARLREGLLEAIDLYVSQLQLA